MPQKFLAKKFENVNLDSILTVIALRQHVTKVHYAISKKHRKSNKEHFNKAFRINYDD